VHRYLFVMAQFNENAVPKPELQELPALPEDAGEAASAAGAGEKSSGEAAEGKTTTDGEGANGEKSGGEAASAAAEPAPDGEAASAAGEADTELARTIAERKRIEAENQQKLDEYQAILKQGRDRVQELNARFGDWYYVVANDVFQKIRLGRDDVIKKKGEPPAAGATGVGAPGNPFPGLPSVPGTGS
jgi:hypothetical protein